MTDQRYHDVEQLHREFGSAAERIRARLNAFASVRDDDIFYELLYCLLTPQSSAVHADAAVEELRAWNFFEEGVDPTPALRNKRRYIRFHNTKARRLLEIRERYDTIHETLRRSRSRPGHATEDGPWMRLWLVRTVGGMGWKEASHFLRNIGYRNLGILDRHILRNLCHHRVVDAIPGSLTPKRYSAIEAAFQEFAGNVGITMDELDLLFWSRETGEIRK